MNRKILILSLALTLAVPVSEAFASRAKELVLGTGDPIGFLDGGSFLFDDHYNIFYNPSYINDHKNWAIIEKSNFSSTGVGTTAEGGFAANFSNFNFGVFLNRVDAITPTPVVYANRTNMRPIEIYLGSDMGIKWGAGLQYSSFSNGANTGTDLTLRGGAQIMNFEPFAWIKLKGSQDTSAAAVTNSGIGVGTRYRFGEWTPFAGVRFDKSSIGTFESKVATGGFGAARSTKIADALQMIYGLSYFRTTANSRNVLPIDFAVEATALSWLTVRAGLSYHLVDRVVGVTVPDTTTGRLGASAHIGKADLNWAIGRAGTGAETAAVLDSQNFDFSNGLFSAVSLGYHW